VPPEPEEDFDPRPNPVNGALGHVRHVVTEEIETGTIYRPAKDSDCSCPMVGVITNVDCPIHGKGLVIL
jgi:hypothetical protein